MNKFGKGNLGSVKQEPAAGLDFFQEDQTLIEFTDDVRDDRPTL